MRRAADGGADHRFLPFHCPVLWTSSDRTADARSRAIPATETIANRRPPPLERNISLFLDLDGTLVELIDRPDEVRADEGLRDVLAAVHHHLDHRLAIVSGRSLAQLDIILGPVARMLALSGSHGCEYRVEGRTESPSRLPALDLVTEEMRRFADRHEGVLLEEKSLGVGLHYRLRPEAEAAARALGVQLAARHGLFLQEGKKMVELRPAGHDKGVAIRHLMKVPPLATAPPVFVGDDVTDEAGFEAALGMGGHGILVGPPRRSAACFRLDGPGAVRNWLKELIA